MKRKLINVEEKEQERHPKTCAVEDCPENARDGYPTCKSHSSVIVMKINKYPRCNKKRDFMFRTFKYSKNAITETRYNINRQELEALDSYVIKDWLAGKEETTDKAATNHIDWYSFFNHLDFAQDFTKKPAMVAEITENALAGVYEAALHLGMTDLADTCARVFTNLHSVPGFRAMVKNIDEHDSAEDVSRLVVGVLTSVKSGSDIAFEKLQQLLCQVMDPDSNVATEIAAAIRLVLCADH